MARRVSARGENEGVVVREVKEVYACVIKEADMEGEYVSQD